MPRISAPTVAEHRARQLTSLLDAARSLLIEQGPGALTLTTLANRAGLSRTGLYEYFRSRDDIITAIIERDLPQAAGHIRQAMQAAGPRLSERLRAYVHTQLEMISEPGLAAVMALGAQTLPAATLQRIHDAHAVLIGPLVDALTEAGVPDPQLRAAFAQGVIEAAAHHLHTAGDSEAAMAALADAAAHQILHGLSDLRRAEAADHDEADVIPRG
ncbi:TetR/AcrR family transcriptional regulator [Nonomuraea sp. K274]|uniref:TetR/AcrR family transcriptional regulator n=1 Tax=Nonomuraea cypriaca TaxID=1187855 RepID=A0A931F6G5_9ACTN|nr:TetR/AcrR family transcriptional regulator [Nonomuraea cypriaca]MBF8193131.1 TetR/AcrR family transcriptional regulator [Nonomuraea cypriaca]